MTAHLVEEKQVLNVETPNSERGSKFALILCDEILNCNCSHCSNHVQFAKKVMENENS
ncbi:MAG: hypothetical protein ACR2F1_07880 [Nitrososphaeraceae archaeon]